MTDTNPTHTQNPPSEPTPANPPRERNREDREDGKPRPDPVRYGDWEKNGRCIDF